VSEQELSHAHFNEAYAGVPPWEIGRPQRPFIAVADQVTSPVLDAGCGTGNASVFFAARGQQVTGIDFVEEAIRQARAKAAERGFAVEFLLKDAMTLDRWDRRFQSVVDSGLFNTFAGAERQRYVKGLSHVTNPGGRLFLLSFTDEERGRGPIGTSRQGIYDSFTADFTVESVQRVRGEVSAGFLADFPEGGPQMWFAIIRRNS